jgi:hypothetical protein
MKRAHALYSGVHRIVFTFIMKMQQQETEELTSMFLASGVDRRTAPPAARLLAGS